MSVNWDGMTQPKTINEPWLQSRIELADAAKTGDWTKVMTVLEKYPEMANVSRPGGKSLFAPLHQAAYAGASETVVLQLISLGAWRTLQNARGERAIDVSQRKEHKHLFRVLEPFLKHQVPVGVLLKIQANFHDVIRGRADELVQQNHLRLPELEPLLELESAEMWFPVPGMYGGFSYQLETFGVEAKLVTKSWCRVAEGSGQRHEITSKGSRLVEEGFV